MGTDPFLPVHEKPSQYHFQGGQVKVTGIGQKKNYWINTYACVHKTCITGEVDFVIGYVLDPFRPNPFLLRFYE